MNHRERGLTNYMFMKHSLTNIFSGLFSGGIEDVTSGTCVALHVIVLDDVGGFVLLNLIGIPEPLSNERAATGPVVNS